MIDLIAAISFLATITFASIDGFGQTDIEEAGDMYAQMFLR